MAITYTSSSTGRVVVPSAFTSINVRTPASGLSAFGIIALIGEANAGPATSASTENIVTNFFTPDQIGSVIAKYGSGNLVDAFRAAATASGDGNISGSPTQIFLFKTNASVAASATVSELGQTSYGTFTAQLAGTAGNLLQWQVTTATAHVDATTGNFTYIPAGLGYNLGYRLQGNAAVTVAISANTLPSALASNTSSIQTSSLLVTGGADRTAFAGLTGITTTCVTASGNAAIFTLAAASVFPTAPVIGDTFYIPTGSNFAGAASANCGYWMVTASQNTVTTASITAVKLANNTAVTVVVVPVNVSASFSATVGNDAIDYSPLKITDKIGPTRSAFLPGASTNVSATATGSTLVVTLTAASFPATLSLNSPRVNDAVYIPSGSVIVGGSSANQGWYTVTAVGTNALTLTRLSNGTPVTVASATLTSTPDVSDITVKRPYTDGQQETVEIYDAGGANLPLKSAFYNLGTTNAASFISTAVLPVILTGTDYQAAAAITRGSDGTQEAYATIGGNATLQVGYLGTTATLAIGPLSITATVTGGTGASWSAAVASFPTINDLVNYINNQTGFFAQAATAASGSLPIAALDQGTFTIASSISAASLPGSIKRDAYNFAQSLLDSGTVLFTPVSMIGLPEPTASAALLTGGAVGGSTGASFTAAIDAMASINPNFIVPLVSQDATADILAGLTDPSSTYTVAGINAYLKGHVVSLSGQIKRKKNRLAVCSFRGSFAAAQAAAQNLATARVALTFQDVKNVGIDGNIHQYQPWMGAVVAASMQAVGLYKSINHKFANVTGIVSPQGDFTPSNYGQLEQALLSGLLTMEQPQSGGFRWVSDQTTYGVDQNFVFNSLQVMYTGDYMAVDLALSFENFAVGQAVSDVSASIAKSFLQAKMSQYLQNKLISPSGNASAGYDSESATLNGPVLAIAVNIYITNAISFVPITLSISQVSQSS